eukprot:TRINITY_DN234_c0_g3_i3.p1 TRINITY_DN234_c0_g3~~TRINITY_DN234_c0_g3_i3.p1  ORF type:complete len:715 (-),score=222.89 TRINITY_DN234_c0_g3_i3:165-2309(-)
MVPLTNKMTHPDVHTKILPLLLPNRFQYLMLQYILENPSQDLNQSIISDFDDDFDDFEHMSPSPTKAQLPLIQKPTKTIDLTSKTKPAKTIGRTTVSTTAPVTVIPSVIRTEPTITEKKEPNTPPNVGFSEEQSLMSSFSSFDTSQFESNNNFTGTPTPTTKTPPEVEPPRPSTTPPKDSIVSSTVHSVEEQSSHSSTMLDELHEEDTFASSFESEFSGASPFSEKQKTIAISAPIKEIPITGIQKDNDKQSVRPPTPSPRQMHNAEKPAENTPSNALSMDQARSLPASGAQLTTSGVMTPAKQVASDNVWKDPESTSPFSHDKIGTAPATSNVVKVVTSTTSTMNQPEVTAQVPSQLPVPPSSANQIPTLPQQSTKPVLTPSPTTDLQTKQVQQQQQQHYQQPPTMPPTSQGLFQQQQVPPSYQPPQQFPNPQQSYAPVQNSQQQQQQQQQHQQQYPPQQSQYPPPQPPQQSFGPPSSYMYQPPHIPLPPPQNAWYPPNQQHYGYPPYYPHHPQVPSHPHPQHAQQQPPQHIYQHQRPVTSYNSTNESDGRSSIHTRTVILERLSVALEDAMKQKLNDLQSGAPIGDFSSKLKEIQEIRSLLDYHRQYEEELHFEAPKRQSSNNIGSGDILKDLSSFNPGKLAAEAMYRQQVRFLKEHMQRCTLQADAVSNACLDNEYTTLTSTEKYINQFRPPPMSLDEAREYVDLGIAPSY